MADEEEDLDSPHSMQHASVTSLSDWLRFTFNRQQARVSSGYTVHIAIGNGVVLAHCNAGVSRSSSIVIGYLMLKEGLPFDDAYSQVKLARPSIRPNPGFYQQLQNYKP